MAESSEKLEDDVLGGLNADFQRSKAELIQRFLLDQEELNKRFEEYTLIPAVDSIPKDLAYYHPAEKDIDQLSTCSTVHGSDASLSDECFDHLDHSNSKMPSSSLEDASKDHTKSRRSKKVLKKKLVRPKTAMESRPFLERVRNTMGQNDPLKNTPSRQSLTAHPLHPQRSSTSWNPNQFQSGLSHIEERFGVLTELNMAGRPLTSTRPKSQANLHQRKSPKIQVLKLPPLDAALTSTPSRVNRGTKNSSLHSTEFLVGEGF